MHLFQSVVTVSLFLVSIALLQTFYRERTNIKISDETSEFIRRGRVLSKDGKCSLSAMNDLFDCMNENRNSLHDFVELIEQKQCYRKYRNLVSVMEFIECIDSNDSEASREDALQQGCECVGL